jgi:ABC-type transport system involved in multi-copper enzyme maturation permease subunit
MRLVRAELLKLRRRMATYVVLGVLLVIMALIYVIVALTTSPADFFDPAADMLRFPTAYATIGEFVFGLGGMLAVVYAAAIAGADWSWGVLRNVVARGESRAMYILAKAAGLAIVFAVGVLIAFAFGVVLVLLAGTLRGHEVGNPLGPTATRQLIDWLGLGYPVLLERAALGFAVAVVLQSQLAGAIVGIVLYIGEGILGAIMLGITLVGRFAGGMPEPGDFEPIGPEWYQYLPFGIGDNVLAAASPGASIEQGFEQLFLRPVPAEQAFVGVLAYLVLALAVSVVAIQRQEIKA